MDASVNYTVGTGKGDFTPEAREYRLVAFLCADYRRDRVLVKVEINGQCMK
jgi:hypothetical protein